MNAEISFIVEDNEDGKALTTLVVGLCHHTEGYSLFQFGLKLESADPEVLIQLLKSVEWKKPGWIRLRVYQQVPQDSGFTETITWSGTMPRFFEAIAKKEIT